MAKKKCPRCGKSVNATNFGAKLKLDNHNVIAKGKTEAGKRDNRPAQCVGSNALVDP